MNILVTGGSWHISSAADGISMVVENWKKILPISIQRVYPTTHGMDCAVDIMQKEISNFKAVQ